MICTVYFDYDVILNKCNRQCVIILIFLYYVVSAGVTHETSAN